MHIFDSEPFSQGYLNYFDFLSIYQSYYLGHLAKFTDSPREIYCIAEEPEVEIKAPSGLAFSHYSAVLLGTALSHSQPTVPSLLFHSQGS